MVARAFIIIQNFFSCSGRAFFSESAKLAQQVVEVIQLCLFVNNCHNLSPSLKAVSELTFMCM